MNIGQFDSVLYAFTPRIKALLRGLPDSIKLRAEEIRIRANMPLALTLSGNTVFVDENSQISPFVTDKTVLPTQKEIGECFRLLCHCSVYAHTDEINEGYIMMDGGHRAGVCGTVTTAGMRDITSINIRIAHQIFGCATAIAEKYDGGGILIAGPPGSGKTTLLRDLIRQLSRGFERCLRVCVIDSRGEISGGGVCELGPNTDIIFSQNKATAAQMAIRTMFPNIIAFDEIGTALELESISDCFNAGVSVITTAHIGGCGDLLRRSVTGALLESGAVSRVVILSKTVGSPYKILSVQEVLDGNYV